jgi:hypothetical protein
MMGWRQSDKMFGMTARGIPGEKTGQMQGTESSLSLLLFSLGLYATEPHSEYEAQ